MHRVSLVNCQLSTVHLLPSKPSSFRWWSVVALVAAAASVAAVAAGSLSTFSGASFGGVGLDGAVRRADGVAGRFGHGLPQFRGRSEEQSGGLDDLFHIEILAEADSLRLHAQEETADLGEDHTVTVDAEVGDGLDESLDATLDVALGHVCRTRRIGKQILRLDGRIGHLLCLVADWLTLLVGQGDAFCLKR